MQEGEGEGAVLAADLDGVDASVGVELEEVGGGGEEVESVGEGDEGGAERHTADAAGGGAWKEGAECGGVDGGEEEHAAEGTEGSSEEEAAGGGEQKIGGEEDEQLVEDGRSGAFKGHAVVGAVIQGRWEVGEVGDERGHTVVDYESGREEKEELLQPLCLGLRIVG